MNRQLLLRKRPIGLPSEDTWELVQNDIPTIKEGEFLVRHKYISLDPAMRGWLNDAKSYIAPVAIDDVMRAGTVGEIIESKHPHFSVGDHVCGHGGVQEYSVTDGKGSYKVDPNLAPLPVYTGTIGMPGLTAYFGLLDVGALQEGETVLVSGAAGAVGSVVGQIAKIKQCTVIGIAGGPEKCKYLIEELGFDYAIDYKSERVKKKVREYCPEGIDVYFDNVGGQILDDALSVIRRKARIVICGAISQYNNTTPIQGPSNYLSLLVNAARMEGFVVFQFAKRYQEGLQEMAGWLRTGQLKSKEHIEEGIENFYPTFLKLFSGDKRGKLVLKV